MLTVPNTMAAIKAIAKPIEDKLQPARYAHAQSLRDAEEIYLTLRIPTRLIER